MSQLENAKAVAAFMNANPDAELAIWNEFASARGMVPFHYSDDDWYRNEAYVVSNHCGQYAVFSIDGYDLERKTLWRALLKGEPVSDWVDSLSAALECAMTHVHQIEQSERLDDPDISFEKKQVII